MELEFKLLEALKAYLSGDTVSWGEEIAEADWRSLLHLARAQRILPMFYHAVRNCPSWPPNQNLEKATRSEVLSNVMVQTTKTVDFLSLYEKFLEAELHPLVVKGIVCSTLYPHPDYRLSGDEDLVITSSQSIACHNILLGHGLHPIREGEDITSQEEAGYQKPESWLYTEVHRSLFASDAQAYGELNQFFAQAFSQAIVQEIQGIPIWTLDHTPPAIFNSTCIQALHPQRLRYPAGVRHRAVRQRLRRPDRLGLCSAQLPSRPCSPLRRLSFPAGGDLSHI